MNYGATMSRPSAGLYLIFLLLILGVQAALLLGKGVLLIDQHEGDALHVLDIALRMGAGEKPHLDFMTPLGFLSFAPIAGFLAAGLGLGLSVKLGSLLFAGLLTPAIFWVGLTRLSGALAYFFGAFVIILATALVYGGADQVASVSMFYNRWAWAVAFVILPLVILPTRGLSSEVIDGIIIGAGLAFLALAKITFFLAFLPALLVGLMLRGQIRSLGVGVITGLAVIGLVTLNTGLDFWLAYLGDLKTIAATPIRSAPGANLITMLVGPTFLAANICLLAAVILIRQSGQQIEGLVLMLAAPGFIYVTYQNWGNDPKWLVLLVILMLSLRPHRHLNNGFGWDISRSLNAVALVSLALVLPTILSLSFSTLRHARLDVADFARPFEISAGRDIMMRRDRLYAPAKRFGIEFDAPKLRAEAEAAGVDPKDVVLFGQKLAACKIEMGLIGLLHQLSEQVAEFPETMGKSVALADTFSPLWLFGKTVPEPQGSPWFYGDMSIYHRADFVLIPACPVTYQARSLVVDYLNKADNLNFEMLTQNDDFILLRRLPD